jgi:hypothetical protein
MIYRDPIRERVIEMKDGDPMSPENLSILDIEPSYNPLSLVLKQEMDIPIFRSVVKTLVKTLYSGSIPRLVVSWRGSCRGQR